MTCFSIILIVLISIKRDITISQKKCYNIQAKSCCQSTNIHKQHVHTVRNQSCHTNILFAFNAYSYCSVCHFTPGFVCTFSLSRLGVWCLLRQYYNNPFWPVTAFYLTWPCVNSLVICSCMDVHCLPSAVYVCLVHILSIMKVFVV